MIDHDGYSGTGFARSKAFYTYSLGAIGYRLPADFPAAMTGSGEPSQCEWRIAAGEGTRPPVCIAGHLASRALLHRCHAAALAADDRDNGAPGPQAPCHGALGLDSDAHNAETVCHNPA